MAAQGKQPMCRSYSTTANPESQEEKSDLPTKGHAKDHRTQARLLEFKRSVSDGGYTHSDPPTKERVTRPPSNLTSNNSTGNEVNDDAVPEEVESGNTPTVKKMISELELM
ncbi:hypothetical protein SNE40_000101 [Patella caerulea]|uniref:Uncharacterized protein n=1 Tax=Patella caerulea TaxID=87958 RepID=A0AAN8Q1T8_PATCE